VSVLHTTTTTSITTQHTYTHTDIQTYRHTHIHTLTQTQLKTDTNTQISTNVSSLDFKHNLEKFLYLYYMVSGVRSKILRPTHFREGGSEGRISHEAIKVDILLGTKFN